jgi:hypothetical protein
MAEGDRKVSLLYFTFQSLYFCSHCTSAALPWNSFGANVS